MRVCMKIERFASSHDRVGVQTVGSSIFGCKYYPQQVQQPVEFLSRLLQCNFVEQILGVSTPVFLPPPHFKVVQDICASVFFFSDYIWSLAKQCPKLKIINWHDTIDRIFYETEWKKDSGMKKPILKIIQLRQCSLHLVSDHRKHYFARYNE